MLFHICHKGAVHVYQRAAFLAFKVEVAVALLALVYLVGSSAAIACVALQHALISQL